LHEKTLQLHSSLWLSTLSHGEQVGGTTVGHIFLLQMGLLQPHESSTKPGLSQLVQFGLGYDSHVFFSQTHSLHPQGSVSFSTAL